MKRFFNKLGSFVPSFVRGSFGKKIIAVFFALLVFAKVSNEVSEEKTFKNVPVIIIKKGNIDVLAYKPETIQMTVRGSRNKLRSLSASNIKVEVPVNELMFENSNMQDISSRTINYTLTPDNVKIPGGISVVDLYPADVSIRVDRTKTKEVPVEVLFQGSLPEDYSMGEIKAVPKIVAITGPDSIIDQIDYLATRPIILDKSSVDSFSVERNFQIGDRKILISPKSVQISVEVYKSKDTRLFQNVPVNMLIKEGPLKDCKIRLLSDKVNVTLGGITSHLSKLKAGEIKAFVDFSHINSPGTYDLNVDCWITDPGVNLRFIYPPVIKAEVIGPK